MRTSDSIAAVPHRRGQHSPARLAAFAAFFKSYMSLAALILACVPIPVASWRLLPVFSQQRGFLTVYSSLFCFLLIAFVFSVRHGLARQMFMGGRWGRLISALPALFIGATLACILGYHATLQQSIQELRQLGALDTTRSLLDQTDSTEIPRSLALSACYLGIFVFAESAFVLMALREYLQDVLSLDEVALLKGHARGVRESGVVSESPASPGLPAPSTDQTEHDSSD